MVNLHALDFAGAGDALEKRLARVKGRHFEIQPVAPAGKVFYSA